MHKTIDIWVAACDFEGELSVLLSFDQDDLYQKALDWAVDDLHNGNSSTEEIEALERLISDKNWDEAIDFWRAWIEEVYVHSYMDIYKHKLSLPSPMDSWWHIWGDF